ncbi:type II toxin-antitoxin system CcdA family antitoxin [Nocardioides sp. AE5]|uniref:type II toxin-antitoxin system CcdA family antitoxin n=1 Tax=Nocardioides sp. AE5 TaxID=2962573 RepID=UPI0028817111|nr:type II toxin-antitoxin system CcdA family antitoxin [Nocardioides sp. AE5]MDT0203828.1 type II toxin-antitoxin system CcdA family antitoxin [Nocardioides sp. AE5]
MARLNVYVPDELAARAKEAGLNVSALTQEALTQALATSATTRWLAALPKGPTVDHEAIIAALDEAREEFGD